jgi:hypothetical protein
VWVALGETLGASLLDLVGWSPSLELPAAAHAQTAQPMMAAMRAADLLQEREDEIDQLFLAG